MLSFILILKQQFIKNVNGKYKGGKVFNIDHVIKKLIFLMFIYIENRTFYFFNGMINIEDTASNLLKMNKKSYKNINHYYIGYIKIKSVSDCNSINSKSFVFDYW